MRYIVLYSLPSRKTSWKGTVDIAKVRYKLRVTSVSNLSWYESMEWNMEENFSMEWNIFFVWNGNGVEENCQYEIWKKTSSS